MGPKWTEGSTWRGLVRLVTGAIAAVVLFTTGDAQVAQETGAELGAHLQTAAESLNVAGAMVVAIIGEGIKGAIGLFKKEAGDT